MKMEALVENDSFISHQDMDTPVDTDQMVSVENNQMVSIENNHFDTIENDDDDDLANMDTDELVNLEDHHHHLVNMDENHQLVTIANNHHFEPFENNGLIPIENNQISSVEYNPLATVDDMATPPPGKRRKKKSVVWEHFTIETVSAGCRRACCKQCKQSFAYSTGSKVAGTSHLKRHIAKGTCLTVPRNRTHINNNNNKDSNNNSNINNNNTAVKTEGTDPPKRRYRTTPAVPYLGFDPDRCRHEISRMIIMHDYPLHIVEHHGFIAFVKSLQPRFDMVSFETVQGDCIATFLKEKQNLQKTIEKIPGRICLTLDMWGSNLTTGYVFLTASYIDTDWKLHRKLLNVIMEPYPESDSAFSHAVASCLADWNLEGRLFTLTINQPLSEGAIENLRALLSIKNPLILNGQFLVQNCLARSLSVVARAAFTAADDTVKKVRDSVKYVLMCESHEEKFLELKQQLQVPSTKRLALDDRTRWNTTYEMLIAASELKLVFSCLDTSNLDYKEAPSADIWKMVEALCLLLEPISEIVSFFGSPMPPTLKDHYNYVFGLQTELVKKEDPFECTLAKAMKERLDEYWKSCSLVLAITAVMDPRFKMKLIEFSFAKIYGEDSATYVKVVDEGIHELYLDYLAPTNLAEKGNSVNPKNEEGQDGVLSNDGLGLTDFDMYIMETASQQSRTELDQYLEESPIPRVHDFDVLGWWKLNKIKYPTLSKMARDILTIPFCTVGPGSVFHTERREMDNYRCSLRAETVEALICAKDWLKSVPAESSRSHVKMEFPI